MDLLFDMSVRYKAEEALGKPFPVEVSIEGEAAPHYLVARPDSLIYRATLADNADAKITLKRSTLNELWAKKVTWPEALDQGLIKISSGDKAAYSLVQLLE